MSQKTRNILLNVLRVALSAALLTWVLSRAGLNNVFAALSTANLPLLILALALFQLGLAIRAYRWQMLLRAVGLEASLRQLLGLSYVGAFFSSSLPTGFGGDVVRAAELQDQSSGAVSAGTVLLDRMIGMSASLSIGLVGLAFGAHLLEPGIALTLGAMATAGILAVAVIIQGDIPRLLGRFLPGPLSLAGEGWLGRLYAALTGTDWRTLVGTWLISLVNNLAVIMVQYIVGRAVGVQKGFGTFVMFAPIVNLTLLLPTVQGLGAREEAYRRLLGSVGVPDSISVATGLGVYAVTLTTGLIGGVYYLAWAGRKLIVRQPSPGDAPPIRHADVTK
jgi:uncharacterized membrane protein YbhN (UPF0104 family)